MPVRSRRLALSAFAGLVPVAIYTVPAGRTAVIRSAIIVNAGNNAGICVLSVGGVVVYRSSVAGNDSEAVPDDLILNPGDTLTAAWTGAADTGTVGLYGSLLNGAPA